MLEVSSIRIAAMMLTLVGIVAAGLDQVDSFNDRTDGQFRRPVTVGGCPSVPQGSSRAAPPFFPKADARHVADKAAPCPLDHVNRVFRAAAPNMLWLANLLSRRE